MRGSLSRGREKLFEDISFSTRASQSTLIQNPGETEHGAEEHDNTCTFWCSDDQILNNFQDQPFFQCATCLQDVNIWSDQPPARWLGEDEPDEAVNSEPKPGDEPLDEGQQDGGAEAKHQGQGEKEQFFWAHSEIDIGWFYYRFQDGHCPVVVFLYVIGPEKGLYPKG